MTQRLSTLLLIFGCLLFATGIIWNKELLPEIINILSLFTTHQNTYPITSFFLFVATFCITVASGFPGGAALAILSGFLFGPYAGLAASLLSTTAGACIIWTIARRSTMFQPSINRALSSPGIRQRIQRSPFLTMLTLRLIPVLPFYPLSIILSSRKFKFTDYLNATVVGLIPSLLAFAIIGNTLQSLNSEKISLLELIRHPGFLIPTAFIFTLLAATYFLRKKPL